MDHFDAVGAAGILQPAHVGQNLLDKVEALLEMVRFSLVATEAAHPAIGMRVKILQVDGQQSRLLGVKRRLGRQGDQVVIGIVGHGMVSFLHVIIRV